ncbi:MAG: glycosyltransferase family 2 protein [Betaproteobacteria bacterium]
MKLWGVAMARNEADVIEAFVRHNLTVLDGLAIVDHGSTDATPSILAALSAEGLPLRVEVDTELEFRQSDIITRLTRRILATTDADFIVLLDADEFLKVPSRHRLEAALASLPPGVHAIQEWHTYVPDFSREMDPASLIRSARRVRHGLEARYRAVVARDFLQTPTLIAEGNHLVVRRTGAENHPKIQHARLTVDESAVAHIPIRSAAQFGAKIAIGWLSCLMQPGRAPGLSSHWRDSYVLLRSGKALTPEILTLLAANYDVPDSERKPLDQIAFADDPFLANIEIIHQGAARADALALVVQFAEKLARRVSDSGAASGKTRAV